MLQELDLSEGLLANLGPSRLLVTKRILRSKSYGAFVFFSAATAVCPERMSEAIQRVGAVAQRTRTFPVKPSKASIVTCRAKIG